MKDPNRKKFLIEKQKEVKQKIMEQSLNSLFQNIYDNALAFDNNAEIFDLIFSILVMLNREILVHVIINYNLTNHRKEIMRDLFNAVKQEVDKRIKEGMG